MKYTIFLIAGGVALLLSEQGYGWIAGGLLLVAFWEVAFADAWREDLGRRRELKESGERYNEMVAAREAEERQQEDSDE